MSRCCSLCRWHWYFWRCDKKFVLIYFLAIATRGTSGWGRGRAMWTFSPKTSFSCLSIKSKKLSPSLVHTHPYTRTSLHDLTRSRYKFPDVPIEMSHATEMYGGCFPFFFLQLIFYDVSEGGQQLCWWWKSLLPTLAKQEIRRKKNSQISALISASAAAVPDSKTPFKGFDLDHAVFLFFNVQETLQFYFKSITSSLSVPANWATDWLALGTSACFFFFFSFFSRTQTTQTDLFYTGKEKLSFSPRFNRSVALNNPQLELSSPSSSSGPESPEHLGYKSIECCCHVVSPCSRRAHWFLVVVCFPGLTDVKYEKFQRPSGEMPREFSSSLCS